MLTELMALKTRDARTKRLAEYLVPIGTETGRDALMLGAARIEVGAVLNHVATLKSEKAKRRHLDKALQRLRADKFDDALQAKEIAMLEAELAIIDDTAPRT
jgi:hypothetical protein